MKWEIKMNKQRELKKEGAGLLFDRMQLLIECYNDERFKEWCRDNNDTRVEYLNRELSDIGQEFLHLKTLVDHFPKRDQWTAKSVREMTAAVMVAQQEERRKQREIAEKAKPPKLIHTAPVASNPVKQATLPLSAPKPVTVAAPQPSQPKIATSKPAPSPPKPRMTPIQYEATISDLESRLKRMTEDRDRLRKENTELRAKLTEAESRKKKKQLV